MEHKSTFGSRLVEARKNKNMTQRALAAALDITPTRLNYWEKDKREPDVQMINKICDVLDIKGNYLLGREEEKKNPPPKQGMTEEQKVEFTEELTAVLSRFGFAGEDGSMSDTDFEMIRGLIEILVAYRKHRSNFID